MELADVSAFFSTTPVDGWDRAGQVWVPAVVSGRLQVFDRFISDRSFGQRKRNFIIGGSTAIPSTHDAIRLPTGQIYLVEGKNVDVEVGDQVATVYLLHEAPYSAQITRLVTAPRASGGPGVPTPTVVGTEFVDLDRYSFIGSEEFDSIRYGIYTLVLSAQADVTTNDWLTIDGQSYDIREKSVQLDLMYLRVVGRGAAV